MADWNFLRYRLLKILKGDEYASRDAGVTIGVGCRIYSNLAASEPWLVSVGDRTTVSVGVTVLTHDGTGWLYSDDQGRRYRYAPVAIGDDCFIGARAMLMPGVRIGSGSIVGAGSVVTKSVPPGSVVAGNPARIVASRDDLMSRVAEWPTEADKRGSTYQEKVDSIRETQFRPEMRHG